MVVMLVPTATAQVATVKMPSWPSAKGRIIKPTTIKVGMLTARFNFQPERTRRDVELPPFLSAMRSTCHGIPKFITRGSTLANVRKILSRPYWVGLKICTIKTKRIAVKSANVPASPREMTKGRRPCSITFEDRMTIEVRCTGPEVTREVYRGTAFRGPWGGQGDAPTLARRWHADTSIEVRYIRGSGDHGHLSDQLNRGPICRSLRS